MESDSKPGLIERLTALLLRTPEDRGQLAEILRAAYERNLIDADVLAIIEGALAASETRVSDVMVPRALMEVVDINEPMATIIHVVIETAHSRFPVIDGDRDKVQGVLLAKDLLRIHVDTDFDLRAWLRPVVFIPESKRLDVLLRECEAGGVTRWQPCAVRSIAFLPDTQREKVADCYYKMTEWPKTNPAIPTARESAIENFNPI